METEISLFGCYQCGAITDHEQVNCASGWLCYCGARMSKPVMPTVWNIVRYLFKNPKKLLLAIKEFLCR